MVAIVFVLLASFAPSADGATFSAESAFQELLAAIQAGSKERFTAGGDEGFQAMPEREFEGLVSKFSPMLASGYTATHLGEFRQKGVTVHYWKLSFTSDADDWLAKLGVRDGKLLGFLIKRP
jgi:hypothetical protein